MNSENYLYMSLYMKMSQNINKTTRHLKLYLKLKFKIIVIYRFLQSYLYIIFCRGSQRKCERAK